MVFLLCGRRVGVVWALYGRRVGVVWVSGAGAGAGGCGGREAGPGGWVAGEEAPTARPPAG